MNFKALIIGSLLMGSLTAGLTAADWDTTAALWQDVEDANPKVNFLWAISPWNLQALEASRHPAAIAARAAIKTFTGTVLGAWIGAIGTSVMSGTPLLSTYKLSWEEHQRQKGWSAQQVETSPNLQLIKILMEYGVLEVRRSRLSEYASLGLVRGAICGAICGFAKAVWDEYYRSRTLIVD